jgi:hypothetical protein
MFIVYSGEGDQYASAAMSKRHGANTSMEYIYLGKVIDREAGIYKSRERGVFLLMSIPVPSVKFLKTLHFQVFRSVNVFPWTLATASS